ncbi:MULTISPECIES: hypothetical protein [unclassified Calothrix]|nr:MULTISPECIES: hypothetical protein [unclassified Calothrix]
MSIKTPTTKHENLFEESIVNSQPSTVNSQQSTVNRQPSTLFSS